jgi:hypothetical protein
MAFPGTGNNGVCSNLTLTDHRLAADYREPYASLAEFPLAGLAGESESEPNKVLAQADNPEIAAKWLGILDAIRTFWLTDKQNVMPPGLA